MVVMPVCRSYFLCSTDSRDRASDVKIDSAQEVCR